MITLYHGSNVRISRIDLAECNPYKDFGQAFYLTTVREQALEIANARVDIFGGEPVINVYQFDEKLLNDGTLSFKQFGDYTDEWATSSTSIATRRKTRPICTPSTWCTAP